MERTNARGELVDLAAERARRLQPPADYSALVAELVNLAGRVEADDLAMAVGWMRERPGRSAAGGVVLRFRGASGEKAPTASWPCR